MQLVRSDTEIDSSGTRKGDYRLILEILGVVVVIIIGYNLFGSDGEVVGQAYVGEQSCGNGVVDDGEQCDGGELAGQTCGGFGFASGTLGCSSSCRYDTLGCTMCGNGALNKGEQCDGSAFRLTQCSQVRKGAGALSCTSSCLYDFSGCSG